MSGTPANLDEYLSTLTDDQRAGHEALRAAIAAAAPGAEESFGYGMPAFRLGDKPLVWYAAWKKHYSLYPISAAIVQAHGADADPYEHAKGTIRFPASEPLPLALVRKLVEARVAELHANGK